MRNDRFGPKARLVPGAWPPRKMTRSIRSASLGWSRRNVARLVSGPRAIYVSLLFRSEPASASLARVRSPSLRADSAPDENVFAAQPRRRHRTSGQSPTSHEWSAREAHSRKSCSDPRSESRANGKRARGHRHRPLPESASRSKDRCRSRPFPLPRNGPGKVRPGRRKVCACRSLPVAIASRHSKIKIPAPSSIP